MPLIFSPLSEEALTGPPKELAPKHAFLMRQIGDPPGIDALMTEACVRLLKSRGIGAKDADASSGSKDFLERILGLIRGTGMTVAIFSGETRGTALANIMLELGFAAMCGKPLMIVKSKDAKAPSDLTRTDWIEYDPLDVAPFERKFLQALDQIALVASYEEDLLDIALEADTMDCAVALERATKAFLLSGEQRLIDKAEQVLHRLNANKRVETISDLTRLSEEAALLIRRARK